MFSRVCSTPMGFQKAVPGTMSYTSPVCHGQTAVALDAVQSFLGVGMPVAGDAAARLGDVDAHGDLLRTDSVLGDEDLGKTHPRLCLEGALNVFFVNDCTHCYFSFAKN